MLLIAVILILVVVVILNSIAGYQMHKRIERLERDSESHHVSIMRLNRRTMGTTTPIKGIASSLPDKMLK